MPHHPDLERENLLSTTFLSHATGDLKKKHLEIPLSGVAPLYEDNLAAEIRKLCKSIDHLRYEIQHDRMMRELPPELRGVIGKIVASED